MSLDTTKPNPASCRLLIASLVIALLGVTSLMLAPLEQLAPAGMDPSTFKWLSLIQPGVIALLAVVTGHLLAHRVGLDAPLLRAILTRQAATPIVFWQLKAGIPAGVVAGLVLIAYTAFAAEFISSAPELPLATRLLYGGITEEFIARWGAMTFGVWLAFKLSPDACRPRPIQFWIGNCFAAALFALGHLPALFAAVTPTSISLVFAALVSNFLPALLFGWLFKARGLEAAMTAHVTAHLVAAAFTAA